MGVVKIVLQNQDYLQIVDFLHRNIMFAWLIFYK